LIFAVVVWAAIGLAQVGISYMMGYRDKKLFMESGQEFMHDLMDRKVDLWWVLKINFREVGLMQLQYFQAKLGF